MWWYMGRALLLLAVGPFFAAIWLASAGANFAHAQFLAGESEWAWILGAASAGSDVLKAVMALAIVVAFRERLWGAFLAALIVWGATTIWSVRSGIGFISYQMADTMAVREEKAVDTNARLEQLQALTRRLAWLSQQEVSTRRERNALSDDFEKTQKAVEELRKEGKGEKAITVADPTKDVFKQLGIEDYMTTATTVLIFLLLMEACSNLGILALSSLFRRPKSRPAPKEKEEKEKDLRPIKLSPSNQEHIAAWAQDAVRRLGPKYKFRSADALYRDYAAFCTRLGISACRQSPHFWDAVRSHCAGSSRSGNRRTYMLPEAVPQRARLRLAV